MQSRPRNNGRLDEDGTDLNTLKHQLGRMDALSGQLTGILNGFDGQPRTSPALLTMSMPPLLSTESIVDCLNLPSKEEAFLLKGPDENNVLPYLKAMGRLKDAADTIEKSHLRSCDKAVYQMKQLLKAGMLHLETLFRKWLSSISSPVDVNTMLGSNNDLMSSQSMKQLSQLSTYIATSETEIGYTVDFTKPYIDIRSTYLTKSLHPLSQSAQLSEKHQGVSYEKGSSEFIKYLDCFARMVKSELEFSSKILGNPQRRTTALKGTLAPAETELVMAGRQLNSMAKRLHYTDSVFVFDIVEKYDKECAPLLLEMSSEVNSGEIEDMTHGFKSTALKNIYEFIEDIKGKRDNNVYLNLSSDGTVHEMTSNTLNYLKRLYLWRDTVEPLLVSMGEGGWNVPPTGHPLSDQRSYDPSLGAALLQKFFVDVLDQMTISLHFKSRGYKKPTLVNLFLMNNYNHTLRQIRSPPLNSIFDEISEAKFSRLVKKQLDAYQESWKPCVENLMDVTYVRGGAIKNSMGNGERQLIKDKFKNFNTEFEDIWRAQTTYAVPDTELRQQVIRDVKNVLVPMYCRFMDKYQSTEFTKNPTKYIKYDKEKLEKMIGHLFEPTA